MITIPVTEIPLVSPGDDVGGLLLNGLSENEIELENGDMIVVAQTIVSKAEGNVVNLESVRPSSEAERFGEELGKDPRKMEMILRETESIVRQAHVLISQTKHGFVCANAGVDSSNVGEGKVTLLPRDPDRSAKEIRDLILEEIGKRVGVIISDSWGRPFRLGAVGFA
ncbi:hypothetical protein AKJ65_03495, partial [candidate division MSBL1 archaeon SCGC-AAA259E19]